MLFTLRGITQLPHALRKESADQWIFRSTIRILYGIAQDGHACSKAVKLNTLFVKAQRTHARTLPSPRLSNQRTPRKPMQCQRSALFAHLHSQFSTHLFNILHWPPPPPPAHTHTDHINIRSNQHIWIPSILPTGFNLMLQRRNIWMSHWRLFIS